LKGSVEIEPSHRRAEKETLNPAQTAEPVKAVKSGTTAAPVAAAPTASRPVSSTLLNPFTDSLQAAPHLIPRPCSRRLDGRRRSSRGHRRKGGRRAGPGRARNISRTHSGARAAHIGCTTPSL